MLQTGDCVPTYAGSKATIRAIGDHGLVQTESGAWWVWDGRMLQIPQVFPVTVADGLAIFHPPGEVFEIRIIDLPKGKNGYKVTLSGYFDDPTKAEQAIKLHLGKANIYHVLNPINPDLMARAYNRLEEKPKATTGDGDVRGRRWLPIDTDPVRPAGISATQEELAAALVRRDEIATWLAGWGWQSCIMAMSGNGGHLLYRVDLPNDEDGKTFIEACLKRLDSWFSDEQVKVDTSVFNAARIWKVYGTKAVKGDAMPTRPHRLAEITSYNPAAEIVTPDMIRAILSPETTPYPHAAATMPPMYGNGRGYSKEQIEQALRGAGVGYKEKRDSKQRVILALDRCLTSEAHKDGACITLEGEKVGYTCHHNSCQGKGWQEVKGILFPGKQRGKAGNAAANGSQKERGKSPKPTDDELRDRWIIAHPLTAYGLGNFRRYQGGIWVKIPDNRIEQEIETVVEQAKDEGIRPKAGLLASVFKLTTIKVTVADEKWDADPDILVCRNGVLHIPTRQLNRHAPDYYATSELPFAYDAAAIAPAFLQVLNETVPDAAAFLQEFAGYCLTIDTSYEIAVWLYGVPGSGKSTVIEGFKAMLGARVGILGLGEIERSQFALTNLVGKTLIISTEQPAIYMKAAGRLNALISGETTPVERKYRDPIEITPHAKILWAMNDYPRVDAGNGLFRRVKVVKFPPLPPEKRNPAIKEQVKQEGAGILNWALDGLARLRARGRFDIPASVQGATQQFQQTNDVPALFVAEMCLEGEAYKTQSSMLYEAYKVWCLANGHKPQSNTTIAEDWQRLGFEKYKLHGRYFWRGVGLRADVPEVG